MQQLPMQDCADPVRLSKPRQPCTAHQVHIRQASAEPANQRVSKSAAADHLKFEEKVVFVGACLSEDLDNAILCLKHRFLLPALQPGLRKQIQSNAWMLWVVCFGFRNLVRSYLGHT